MPKFTEVSQDVLTIAEDLIAKYHPILRDVNIGFVFRDEPTSAGGHSVYAGVTKISPALKPHLDLDVLIWVHQYTWESTIGDQRKALIDHQLCHIWLGNGGIQLVGHDLEEFEVVLDRWGLWNHDLFGMVFTLQKATQFSFDLKVEEKPRTGSVKAIDPALVSAEAAS